jgi:hypothetical protein
MALLDTLRSALKSWGTTLTGLGAPAEHNDVDVVTRNFQGKMTSKLTCECCGDSRSVEESFLGLSLPLELDEGRISPLLGARVSPASVGSDEGPPEGGGGGGGGVDVGVNTVGSAQSPTGGPVGTGLVVPPLSPPAGGAGGRSPKLKGKPLPSTTLEECLEKFAAEELLTDTVECSNCRKQQPFKKQMGLAELPNILCLHLKRFDAAKNIKLKNAVEFGMDLDLGRFLHGEEGGEGGEEGGEGGAGEGPGGKGGKFSAFATIHHSGSLHQGHYTANVKAHGNWYHVGDHSVFSTNVAEVLAETSSIYMILYQREA